MEDVDNKISIFSDHHLSQFGFKVFELKNKLILMAQSHYKAHLVAALCG